MVEITRRKLVGGALVLAGSLYAASTFQDEIVIKIRHEFDEVVNVAVEVAQADSGKIEYQGTKVIGPNQTARIEFVDTDMDDARIQIHSDHGSGSYTWAVDSDLEVVLTDGGPIFST